MIPLIVIDANAHRSAALKDYLTGTGAYCVIASASPEVTISRSLAGEPGLVIAVQDQGQDGILFLKNLRVQGIELPVIILAKVYDPDTFGISVANNAEYMVMSGASDIWYPVL